MRGIGNLFCVYVIKGSRVYYNNVTVYNLEGIFLGPHFVVLDVYMI